MIKEELKESYDTLYGSSDKAIIMCATLTDENEGAGFIQTKLKGLNDANAVALMAILCKSALQLLYNNGKIKDINQTADMLYVLIRKAIECENIQEEIKE